MTTEEGICITTPLRRRDVADLSGATLYTASRVPTGWEKESAGETRRLQIVLGRSDKLEAPTRGEGLKPQARS